MNYKEVEKILQDNKITNIDNLTNTLENLEQSCGISDVKQLVDILKGMSKISRVIATGDARKPCLELERFNFYIPDCRIFYEIRKRFYPNVSRDNFASLLLEKYKVDSTPDKKKLGLESIKGYLSCKNCTDLRSATIKNEVLKDILCNGLEIKLKENKVFEQKIRDIEKLELVPITKENYIPKIDSDNKEAEMNKEEKDRLYDVIHVTREEFKNNLSDSTKTDGSHEYKLNLALYAFERGLDEESFKLVEILKESQKVKNTTEYLQLKAKLLSNFKRDKEAIETLETLIDEQKPSIDVETHNLLAASIKRHAFEQYENRVISEIQFKKELSKAKEIYSAIFNINKNYYPAINIIYLELMLIDNNDVNNIQKTIEDAQSLWDSSDIKTHLKEKDWWSFISDVEFSILMTDYNRASIELSKYLKNLDEEVINEFSISSTIRQLELYQTYCPSLVKIDLDEFIVKLKDINSQKHLSMYVKEK